MYTIADVVSRRLISVVNNVRERVFVNISFVSTVSNNFGDKSSANKFKII